MTFTMNQRGETATTTLMCRSRGGKKKKKKKEKEKERRKKKDGDRDGYYGGKGRLRDVHVMKNMKQLFKG